MPIFCKQCEEEIVNGEKCICISEGVMHGTEFEPDSCDEEDGVYLHSRCVRWWCNNTAHLCETCKHKEECNTAGEIDHFDEVLDAHVSDEDRWDRNPRLTTIVIECERYEKEE